MALAKYISSWQSVAGAAEECQYLYQLQEDIKVLFLTESVKSVSYM